MIDLKKFFLPGEYTFFLNFSVISFTILNIWKVLFIVYFLTASANSGSYTGLRSLLLFSAHRLRTPNEGLDQTNLKPQGQKRKKIQERRQETCKKARDVFCYLEKMDLTKQKNSWVRYLIIRGPAAFWMPNFQMQYIVSICNMVGIRCRGIPQKFLQTFHNGFQVWSTWWRGEIKVMLAMDITQWIFQPETELI